MNREPASSERPPTTIGWLNDKFRELGDRLDAATQEYAEALDSGDRETAWRASRATRVIEDRQLHLSELEFLLAHPDYPAVLARHQDELTAALLAQNGLVDQVEGHLDLLGQFKAGTEAEKLRARIDDTTELLGILDK